MPSALPQAAHLKRLGHMSLLTDARVCRLLLAWLVESGWQPIAEC
jgi:hypothetical protein